MLKRASPVHRDQLQAITLRRSRFGAAARHGPSPTWSVPSQSAPASNCSVVGVSNLWPMDHRVGLVMKTAACKEGGETGSCVRPAPCQRYSGASCDTPAGILSDPRRRLRTIRADGVPPERRDAGNNRLPPTGEPRRTGQTLPARPGVRVGRAQGPCVPRLGDSVSGGGAVDRDPPGAGDGVECLDRIGTHDPLRAARPERRDLHSVLDQPASSVTRPMLLAPAKGIKVRLAGLRRK